MTRTRQVLILTAAILAFAGMIVLVVLGITSRRDNRDLVFGLERCDVLLEDGGIAEAAELVPWLAERARDSARVLAVLKRGQAVADAGGGHQALHLAAQVAVDHFPGSTKLGAIAVYAAIRSGHPDRALDLSRDAVAIDYPSVFAWALLENGFQPSAGQLPDGIPQDADPLFIAGLDAAANTGDLERAWRLTGDWRYAADAAVVQMQAGSVAAAHELVVAASISLHSATLAADVCTDAGDTEAALRALRSAPDPDEPAIRLRIADALLSLGAHDQAKAIYNALVETAPAFSAVPYLNLAWLSTTPAEALSWYERAVSAFPDTWIAVQQRALYLAATSLNAAYNSLADYTGPAQSSHESLLRLRLAPDTGSRAYEASVWRLLEDGDASDDAYRFAAWYFLGRSDEAALRSVLSRAPTKGSWTDTYEGVLSARNGNWAAATTSFQAAFAAAPSWHSRLNLGLALYATGATHEAARMFSEAAASAIGEGAGPEGAAAYVAVARTAADRSAAHAAATAALELDPTNTEALLIRNRLESGSGY